MYYFQLFAKKFHMKEPELQDLQHWVYEASEVIAPCPEGNLLDAFPWTRFLKNNFYKRVTLFIDGFIDGWLYKQCMERKVSMSEWFFLTFEFYYYI